jgi:hypothetical protein
MYGFNRTARRGFVMAVLVSAAIILSGCATSYNHSFDPAMGYGGLKSYSWVSSGITGASSDLVVKNVQYVADQALEAKGFRKTAENPDMLISVQYENEIGINEYGYQLRMLTIGIQKADSRQIIWRGTATGSISTDAASGDLKKAVQGILAKFPPAK